MRRKPWRRIRGGGLHHQQVVATKALERGDQLAASAMQIATESISSILRALVSQLSRRMSFGFDERLRSRCY
jgi:hypothetical protein